MENKLLNNLLQKKNTMLILSFGKYFIALILALLSMSVIDSLSDKYWCFPYFETIIALLITIVWLLSLFLFILSKKLSKKDLYQEIIVTIILVSFDIALFSLFYFLYNNTPFSTYGLRANIDIGFKTAFLVKNQENLSLILSSAFIKDLHIFYSPFYWQVLLILMHFTNIPAYSAVKWGFLLSIFILPLIGYDFWKKILSSTEALLITLFYFVEFVYFDRFDYIDHFMPLFFIIPYFLYYLENTKGKKFTVFTYISAGLIGMILFTCYFFYFFPIVFYYALKLITDKSFWKKDLKRLIVIGILIFTLSLYFIYPLVQDILKYGFESHQNFYIPDSTFLLPLPFLDLSQTSTFILIYFPGFIKVFTMHKENRLYPLRNLFLSLILFIFLCLALYIIQIPLPVFRVVSIISYVLLVLGISFWIHDSKRVLLSITKIVESLKANLTSFSIEQNENASRLSQNNSYEKRKEGNPVYLSFNHRSLSVSLSIILITLLFININSTSLSYVDSSIYQSAFSTEIPVETIAAYQIMGMDYIYFTNDYDVVDYIPLYTFLGSHPHYTHPSALYQERFRFLYNLSLCETSLEFYLLMNNSKFGNPPIYVFVPTVSTDPNYEYVWFNVITEEKYQNDVSVTLRFRKAIFENKVLFDKIVINNKVFYKYHPKFNTLNITGLIENATMFMENVSYSQDLNFTFSYSELSSLISIEEENMTDLINSTYINELIINQTTLVNYTDDASQIASITSQIFSNTSEFQKLFINSTETPIIIRDSFFNNSELIGEDEQSGLKILNSKNILIENCTFTENLNGIIIENSYNVTIRNCSFYNNSLNGMEIFNSNVTIEFNSFYDNGLRDIILNRVQSANITNNSIVFRNTPKFPYFNHYSVYIDHGLLVNMSNNTLMNQGKETALTLISSWGCNITHNNISQSQYAIAAHYSRKIAFVNNTLNNTKYGFFFYTLIESNITSNVVSYTKEHAIWMEKSILNKIILNSFNTTRDYVIFLKNSQKNTFVNNTFESNETQAFFDTDSYLNRWDPKELKVER